MKNSNFQMENYLDFIIIVSARKMQYLAYVKKKKLFHNSEEYQDAIKNTIANMDNFVFLTAYEKKSKMLRFDNKIVLDQNEIMKNFNKIFKKMYPNLYT